MEERKGPVILQTGTFSSQNKGDAAMTLAAFNALRSSLPGSEITILTPHPELDLATYTSTGSSPCSRRRPIRALQLMGRAAIYRLIRRCCSFATRWALLDPELARYCSADLVIDLSGDGLTNTHSPNTMLSHLVPIIVSELVGTRVALIAQTIGPLGLAGLVAKPVLDRATLITTREEYSTRYLRRLGVAAPIRQTADMAFLMERSSPERAEEILHEEGISASSSPLVALVPSTLYGSRSSFSGSASRYERHVRTLAGIADHIVTKHGAHLLLISHVRGPERERNDLHIAGRIKQAVERDNCCHLIRGNYRPEEIKSLFGRCELVITMRTHAAIAATSCNVPTIAISYSRKTLAIMKRIGQEEWVLDVKRLDLDQLLAKVDAAWAARELIRQSLQHQVAKARSDAWKNIALIKELVAA